MNSDSAFMSFVQSEINRILNDVMKLPNYRKLLKQSYEISKEFSAYGVPNDLLDKKQDISTLLDNAVFHAIFLAGFHAGYEAMGG